MEFKGTKGEWNSQGLVKESNGWVNIITPSGSITVYGECLSGMNESQSRKAIEKVESDANLVAAAPELLMVLQKILDYDLEEVYPGFNKDTGIEKAINKALK